MITLRPADERGHTRRGGLDCYHTFSFSSYHDPRYMASAIYWFLTKTTCNLATVFQ